MTAIAVVGIGCSLPGSIEWPETLWTALLRGADLVTEIPPQRYAETMKEVCHRAFGHLQAAHAGTGAQP